LSVGLHIPNESAAKSDLIKIAETEQLDDGIGNTLVLGAAGNGVRGCEVDSDRVRQSQRQMEENA
jgi:hypothetical protein